MLGLCRKRHPIRVLTTARRLLSPYFILFDIFREYNRRKQNGISIPITRPKSSSSRLPPNVFPARPAPAQRRACRHPRSAPRRHCASRRGRGGGGGSRRDRICSGSFGKTVVRIPSAPSSAVPDFVAAAQVIRRRQPPCLLDANPEDQRDRKIRSHDLT